MKFGIIKEQNEPRVSMTPVVIKKYVEHGHHFFVEKEAGKASYFPDEQFEEAGARITDLSEIEKEAEILISFKPLPAEGLRKFKKGTLFISLFAPYSDQQAINDLTSAGHSAISMDMIPRTTLAQAMDVLSSMASLAGYRAVLEAATFLPKYFPMLTTAAGSIPPTKVLVLGAGVAGLQAIATARRLGAVVEASDTRLAAKEEVESLGGKFLMVEGAKDDSSAGGYAVEQTEDFKQRQRDLVRDRAVKSDVIITTAQLRGKPAPVLVTSDMVAEMKPGSVIIDLASSTGGNCELTKDEEVIVEHGVTIVGSSNLAAKVPNNASQLFSKNVANLLDLIIREEGLEYNMDNEIIKSSLVVKEGEKLYQ